MLIMARRLKESVEQSVTLRVVKRYEVAVFVRVMGKKSTTSGTTVWDLSETYQLGWYLLKKIVHVSLKEHS